jgi:sec-independent protein translocase protein TatA
MELVLILIIVLIIFGAGKLPQLGEGLVKAIKGFKKTVHEPDAIDVTPADQTQQAHQQTSAPRGPDQPGHQPSSGTTGAAQPEQAKQG